MGKKSFPKAIPEEYKGIQANGCKEVTCANFGVDPSQQPTDDIIIQRNTSEKQSSPPSFKVQSSGKNRKSLFCLKCMERKEKGESLTVSSTIVSNVAAHEEYSRFKSYLTTPEPTCPNDECEYTTEYIKKNGKTAKGSQRFKCTHCKTSFTTTPDTRKHRRPEINKLFFKLLVRGNNLRDIASITEIGTETIYHKINFLHRQCMKFAAHREKKLLDGTLPIDRLYLATDGQTLKCNWTNRRNKKNVEFYGIGTACLNSGYVFAFNFNYDSCISQESLERESTNAGDDAVADCYRKYARLWTRQDYSDNARAMAASKLRKRVNKSEESLEEHVEKYNGDTMLPNKGVWVHHEYTMMGHFLLLKDMFKHVGKVRFYMDADQGLDRANLAIFSDRIIQNTADSFVITCDKSKNSTDLRNHRRERARLIKEIAGRPKSSLSSREYREIVNELIIANLDTAQVKGNPKRSWIKYPILDKTEIDKEIAPITDISKLDLHHQANLIRKGSLHAIDKYFMIIRRKLSFFERPISSSAGNRRVWHGKSPYNPDMYRKVGDIYRVYYNYVKKGDDKKTPAMRIGLAKGVVELEKIIYFDRYK